MRIGQYKYIKNDNESNECALARIINSKFYDIKTIVNNIAQSKGWATIELEVAFSFPTNDTIYPELTNLYNLYKKIGMESWWHFMSDGIYHDRVSTKEDSNWMYRVTEKDFESFPAGNGYNHLPWDIISRYRETLLGCITFINVDLCYSRDKFIINIEPEFDKFALVGLYDLVSNSRELQEYADKLSDTYSGIAKYYADKAASGDNFTGD